MWDVGPFSSPAQMGAAHNEGTGEWSWGSSQVKTSRLPNTDLSRGFFKYFLPTPREDLFVG